MAAVAEVMPMRSERADFDDVFYRAVRCNETVILETDYDQDVVVVEESVWSGLQETLYLYSIPGFMESIDEARAEGLEGGIPITKADFDV